MLTGEERAALASSLCARMAVRHAGRLLLSGVYGSTAAGTDSLWSDLDLLAVVTPGEAIADRHLLYRGIAVGIQLIDEPQLLARLTKPDSSWPYWMGVLAVLQPLSGNAALLGHWRALGRAVSTAQLRRALTEALPALVFESYGRIQSCRDRANERDIGCAAIEMLLEMRTALCLLNGRWVTHDYFRGIEDSFAFLRLPVGYQTLAPALWQARTIEETVQAAEPLFAAFLQLLGEEDLPRSAYEGYIQPEDLPV